MNFEEFHIRRVPALLAAGQGAAAASDIGEGRSLTLRSPGGGAYTYRSSGGDLRLEAGDTGGAGDPAIELADDAFDDLLSEAWSVFGLLYGDRVKVRRGDFNAFARWEAPLQALWFDRPIYGTDSVAALNDLDVTRDFTLEDTDEQLRAFLATAGFLVLRGVFSAAEIAGFNAIVADQLAKGAPGDGRSWWATRADGEEVCCRLTYLAQRSPEMARLASDSRLTRLAAIADPRMLPCTDRLDGMSVVIKHPSVVAGLSDLPWHRDCGVGGHRVLCPGLNIGIQLDRADAQNGQLHFLAGSHHHAAQQTLPPLDEMPTIAVDAEPGDVTVHFSHVLHAAPAPSSPTAGRKAMYVGFHLPEAFDVVGEGEAYNDVLVKRDAGRVKSPDEVMAG
ncbi:MAG TPA: phytanoyl-CoA dioxygenase family protein [Frankiaceae bacterium]|jgi:ectoine hydroxylase-related dioxygenase (phytanoyl-CoA dioxygenase family)|nr:phytanoyl-CoA dioxygenase family protein [Frankiaceae bacterium]